MARLKHECLTHITTSRELPCEGADVTFIHFPKWGTHDEGWLRLIIGLEDGDVLSYVINDSDIEDRCMPSTYHRGHEDTVTCIDTIKEKKRILTISHDGTFREWHDGDTDFCYVYNKNDIHRPSLLSLLLMCDEFYIGDVEGNIKAYHSNNRQFLRNLRLNASPITHLRYYNSSSFLAGQMDGKICLWRRKEEVPPRRILRGLQSGLSGLEVHPEGFAYASNIPTRDSLQRLLQNIPLESLSAEAVKGLNFSKGSLDTSSFSWDLTSGWQDQLFPNDITCMELYLQGTVAEGSCTGGNRLITGHTDGTVKMWLTEGRSSEAIAASRKCKLLNDKLYKAEKELEDLRKVEEREFAILEAIKNTRKPYFGLNLLLTSAEPEDGDTPPNLPGMTCLKNSTRLRPAEDDLTPSLNKVFQNSLDARPELLWTGLQALRRHIASDEAAQAVKSKDSVDAKREVIAQIRELAVAADRNISDILSKGQLLRTLKGLKMSVTALSASAGMVYASSRGDIRGWDMESGVQKESLMGLEGSAKSLAISGRHVIASDSRGVLVWKPKMLPQNCRSRIRQSVYECRYMLPKIGIDADTSHVLSYSVVPSDVVEPSMISSAFDALSHNGQHIHVSKFMSYWNSLEHYGLPQQCNKIKSILASPLRSGCRDKTLITSHEFEQIMLGYFGQ
eukprot:TRINITY_DN8040_c0_g1_i1.p1 TRINITY_DN8040_c0_g1~~TRINITY_DN8040_c0_g1_i1.p1  ORF type:complete len:675 (+),score=91.14 TRINITY_DN8040_c0_g1_i1:96-2120(+)